MTHELVQGWTDLSVEVGRDRHRNVTYRVYREDDAETIELRSGEKVAVDPKIVGSREVYETLIRQSLREK